MPRTVCQQPVAADVSRRHLRCGKSALTDVGCYLGMLRRAEQLLGFAQHLHEAVNLRCRVIEVEAAASRGFDAELAHERLVAMMPATQCDAALVGHGYHVVRVDVR